MAHRPASTDYKNSESLAAILNNDAVWKLLADITRPIYYYTVSHKTLSQSFSYNSVKSCTIFEITTKKLKFKLERYTYIHLFSW